MRMLRWLVIAAVIVCAFVVGFYAGRASSHEDTETVAAGLPATEIPADLGPQTSGQGDLANATPQGDEATDAALVAVEMAFPGWAVELVKHSEDWRQATVRAAAPDGKARFLLDLEWDDEIAGYAIVSARAVTRASSTLTVKLPDGIAAALRGNPKLGRATSSECEIRVVRLTSSDAVVEIVGGREKWRVYLVRAANDWVVKKAKRLQ